jgi:hypothetical protein
MIPITRLERVLNAKRSLPEDQRSMFDDLFVALKSEDQVCRERGLTMTEFQLKSAEMLRNLRAVAT